MADRYRFEAELGRGATGTVYRARDLSLGRVVAIKMLHRVLTNEIGAARFRSEVRIAADLRHPSIVALHAFDEVDDRLFYVMDYLPGETLRQCIARGRLSSESAIQIAGQVADALQHAHHRDIIHRDVKPENIMLVDGRAFLVDFGLARAIGQLDRARLTASGITVGTPQYLSPEQAAAEREIGPATDQYSLACVVYEMFVGEPPFNGPTAAAIGMRHISERPAAIAERRSGVANVVSESVARALEKQADHRFPTVQDFASALGYSGTARISTKPSSPRRRYFAFFGLVVLTIALFALHQCR